MMSSGGSGLHAGPAGSATPLMVCLLNHGCVKSVMTNRCSYVTVSQIPGSCKRVC
jgi:hypothetical protein